MNYEWCNDAKLDTLSATGEGDVLTFSAGEEKAVVTLKDGDIASVTFSLGDEAPVTITPEQAHEIVVGEKNWERDVFHYLKPGGAAPTMRLGITKHRGLGTWSSLPHDFEESPEAGFEEIFFYLIEGGSGRGVQVGKGMWYDGSTVDAVWPIRDRVFGTVPMGYHPVVGEPQAQVSYIWIYLAKKPEWEKVK